MNARHFYAGEEFDREHPPVALRYLIVDALADLFRRSTEWPQGGESPNNGAATDATATAPKPEPSVLTRKGYQNGKSQVGSQIPSK